MTRIHESWRQVSSLPANGNELDGERWRQWKATAASSGHAELIRELEDCGPLHTLLEQACSGSPFIAKCLAADVNFVQKLLLNGADDSLAACLAHVSSAPQQAPETQNEIMNRLRRCKQNAALTIALAEIAGSWPTMKLAEACTSFAKAALGAAVQHLLAQAHEKGGIELPDLAKPEQGSGLTVIGMGKFGAGELNYSSDIDIIILFDDAIAPVADGAHQRIFSKFARDLVACDVQTHGRRICFPYRSAPAPRSEFDTTCCLFASCMRILCDRWPDLGTGGDDQGKCGCRRSGSRREIPGVGAPVYLASQPRFCGYARHSIHQAANRRP